MRAGDSLSAPSPSEDAVRAVLDTVLDPEVPVLSIVDLGIVRHVQVNDDTITVGLSPTYSGCPATEVIEQSVQRALARAGFDDVRLERVLSPPWTTRWISQAGRQKLLNYGIAPPAEEHDSKRALLGEDRPRRCPHCRSEHTERVSEFGSTPCKALYRCIDCREPFEYFKCI
jgi:ring-1,2-phenylacetyl-CoA epoxidase subunit PaaD